MTMCRVGLGAILLAGIWACGGPPKAHVPPREIRTEHQIVTDEDSGTAREREARGQAALSAQDYKTARHEFEVLLKADPEGLSAKEHLWRLAVSLEGLSEREKAHDRYIQFATRYAAEKRAKVALLRAGTLDAYLENWQGLAKVADLILSRSDLDDVDRIMGLGARGLSKVELGDDLGASRDVHEGLDLSDRIHYAEGDVLPVAGAQLRFALGEIRRVRSERITFDPVPEDFLVRLEQRASGLLEAQAAYADAVRSEDPHWATMSGLRVGEMYRTYHRDLVNIPAPKEVKTERLRQVFFAFMHIRYRILLEKGLRQLDQTLKLGERIGDASSWIQKAKATKAEMEKALAEEKTEIAKYPFTEDEVRAALAELQKKTLEKPKTKK